MKSRAAIFGHPLHPVLVSIPIGLWSFAVVCDLIFHLGWGDDSWKKAALYCLAGGLVGAVPAIITGLIDFYYITEPAAVLVARFHLILNIAVLPLYAFSIWLRWMEVPPTYSLLPVALSGVGFVMIGLSGWLGGELVSKFGISVRRPFAH